MIVRSYGDHKEGWRAFYQAGSMQRCGGWIKRFLIVLLCSCPVWGNDIHFEHITRDDGLSSNFIRCILQEDLGFIWIGTQGGLNRYDGYQFRIFSYDPGNPKSISNNQIMALHEDRDGRLWVATGSGLNLFNPADESFERYLHDPKDTTTISNNLVRAIAEDMDGALWIGTQHGLNRFDPETGLFQRFSADPDREGSLSHNTVNAALVNRNGDLWIGTADGLNRYDARSGTFETFRHDPENSDSLSSSEITVLYEDRHGVMWVGTIGGGVNRYHSDGTFSNYRRDPERSPESADNISGLTEDHDGKLWVTSLRGINYSGLHAYDRRKDRFTRYFHDPANPRSLTWNYATYAYVDHSGILWVGTSRGLNKYDANAVKFKLYQQFPSKSYDIFDNYYGIYVDKKDRVWLGLDMPGFVIFDRPNNRYIHKLEAGISRENVVGGGIISIAEDNQERVWLGTAWKGLVQYDADEDKEKLYSHDPSNPNSLSSNDVTYIAPSDTKLWVGTSQGLNHFDPETEMVEVYLHEPDNPRSLSGNRVSYIYEDRSGVLWVGTGSSSRDIYVAGAQGLSRFHPETSDFTVWRHDPNNPLSLSNDNVNVIYEDTSNRFWIGSNNGLNLMDRETGLFLVILPNDGLPNENIIGILEDSQGALWLSTLKGLSRFDPLKHSFKNYDLNDGLQDHRYNANSFFKTEYGEMFFGGTRGLNAFFPETIADDPFPPMIVFTDFKLFNTSVSIGEESPLKQHISLTREIRLDHDQNDLTIDFAALHFSRPLSNRYKFYLENYEKNWRREGSGRSASYTNLDPGAYTFRVKASNKDGVWSKESLNLKVVIDPPWTHTWWAMTLYVILSAALIFLVISLQMGRTRRRLELRARQEIQEARLREAEAQARAIESDNRRKTIELEKARQLQLSMLPKALPKSDFLEIAAYTDTATEVGGDYYDFAQLEDGGLLAAVGDATGHGLQAGIMVAATKGLFNAFRLDKDLADILRRTSNALKGMGLHNMFMGLTVSRIYPGRAELASAGMPFPMIYRADSAQVEEIQLRAIPMGALADFTYPFTNILFQKGDVLLFMSDGLPETFNDQKEMLGKDRLKEGFASLAQSPAQEIVDGLVGLADEWAAGLDRDDDVTLVAFKYV